MAYSLGPVVANLNGPDTKADHKLGDTCLGDGNTVWIYGQASEAVAAGTCTINTTTYAITDAAGRHTTAFAIASGEHAWVQDTAPFTPLATVV